MDADIYASLLFSVAILLGFSLLFWAIGRKTKEGFIVGFLLGSIVLYVSDINRLLLFPAIILFGFMLFSPVLRGGGGG